MGAFSHDAAILAARTIESWASLCHKHGFVLDFFINTRRGSIEYAPISNLKPFLQTFQGKLNNLQLITIAFSKEFH